MSADPDRYPYDRPVRSFFVNGADAGPLPTGPPLIAYGANASPEALARKLPGARIAALAAKLRGWAVVHSAHLSPYGAVPATIIRDERAEAAVHVLFVDEGRARMDATEPNYRRLWLHDLQLDADHVGPIASAEAYVSRHGPLLLDGAHVPLGSRPQPELRAAIA
jgi:hypothetical protein